MNRTARNVVAAALAASVAFGVNTPAATADDGGHDGYSSDRDGGWDRGGHDDRDDWDDGRDGWEGHRHGDRHHGGWSRHDGDRDGAWHARGERDGKHHVGDRDRAGDHGRRHEDRDRSYLSFDRQQKMLVLAIARSDEYLASLAYRIREADVDPAVKGAVLTIIDGLRADLDALEIAAENATTKQQLRDVYRELRELQLRILWGVLASTPDSTEADVSS
ncbi:MAG: hypothetical protein ACRDPJ_18435 [Nocardioidaceae bacterium]